MTSCEKVLVVGSGLMGAGITQVIAQAGIKVICVDHTEDVLRKGNGFY